MGRPRGSKNKSKGDGPSLTVVSSAGVQTQAAASDHGKPGHNSKDLSDDEQRVLHFNHVAEYKKALAVKKSADADIRNVGKRIKAEGDSVRAVKRTIDLETPEGEAKFKAEFEEAINVARWNGLPMGSQGNLFGEERRPLEERAYEVGKNSGAKGETLRVPDQYGSTEDARAAYVKGYHESQSILASKIKATTSVLRPTKKVAEQAAAAAVSSDEDDALGSGSEDGNPWPDDVQVATAKAPGGSAPGPGTPPTAA